MVVNDLFELNCFNGASLISGITGTEKKITSVGIIDSIDNICENINYFDSSFFEGKLILSSAFITLSVEEQKNFVLFLYHLGASGLVIFNNFIHQGTVHNEAMLQSNETSFPLILLQSGTMSYISFINEISEKINSVITVSHFTSELISKSSDIKTLLKQIAQMTEADISIYDWGINLISSTSKNDLFLAITKSINPNHDFIGKIKFEDELYFYRCYRLTGYNGIELYVIIVTKESFLSDAAYKQVLQIIQLYSYIHKIPNVTRSILGNTIISGNQILAKKQAGLLKYNLNNLNHLLICCFEKAQSKDVLFNLSVSFEDYFKNNNISSIACYFADESINGITLILSCNSNSMMPVLSSFSDEIYKMIECRSYFFLSSFEDISDVNGTYTRLVTNIDHMKCIYPKVRIFSEQHLQIAETISTMPTDQVKRAKELKHLLSDDRFRQLNLIDTLSTYLIDTDSDIEQTAALMFLHKSTIKYRINRACEILSCNIRSNPDKIVCYFLLCQIRLLGS